MKKVILMFSILYSALMYSQEVIKDYNHLINPTNMNTNIDHESCNMKSRLTVENKTSKTITSVTLLLTIKEKKNNNKIVYKKKHTISCLIKADEVDETNAFVWNNCRLANDSNFYTQHRVEEYFLVDIKVIGYK